VQGTTLSVVKALSEVSRATGRRWGVVGYEAMPDAAATAAKVWAHIPNVMVVNELMLTEDDLEDWILPHIEGPPQDKFPGRGFYKNFYEATSSQIEAGSLGGWFKTALCRPHIVLIDSTRFAQLGILATVFHKTNSGVDNRTVFVIENDFWEDPARGELGKQRDTLMTIGENLKIEVLTSRKVPGERWPWFIMRGDFAGSTIDAKTGDEARRRRAQVCQIWCKYVLCWDEMGTCLGTPILTDLLCSGQAGQGQEWRWSHGRCLGKFTQKCQGEKATTTSFSFEVILRLWRRVSPLQGSPGRRAILWVWRVW